MSDDSIDFREQLAAVSASLRTLRDDLERDLAEVRALPESDISAILHSQLHSSRARTLTLIERIRTLRETAEIRRRTLQRLRARMHQLRGGARPH
jgi:hypothetical protein